jgi:predicted unusual protein kinase regulating ubiquinone biosynthesis (AarF/ABC1/UbiB family)
MITRVGRRISDALRDGISKQVIYDGFVAGVKQLHAHGFAHCDISISNVFVDDKGLAFLVDLEYLTPLNDPPPHKTRIPIGSYVSTVSDE